MRLVNLISCLLPLAVYAESLNPKYHGLPSLREQAAIQDSWRDERLANIPQLLRKHGVDSWLMSQREYAEDTAFWSLKTAIEFSARRRTVHLFFASAPEGMQTAYKFVDNTKAVFEDLKELLETHQPRSIALNVDADVAFAGGLHVGMYNELVDQLGPKWSNRFVEAPMVAIEYIATMPKAQLKWYKRLQETAWAMISEAFSEKVIEPGKTTTEDVEWWLRSKIQAMNYSTWFHPGVSILYTDIPFRPEPEPPAGRKVIEYHDILHVDFGVTALGLNTDTQHLAYVLGPNESRDEIPQGLKDGLRNVNQLQDIVRENMIVGTSGNDILKSIRAQMKQKDITGRIYCHPIGDWGHAAGTLIGMTNLQDGVPVLGDIRLLNQTYYSVELYAEYFVPEKNNTVKFYQEEDVYWVEDNHWDWVYGQQTEFLVVQTKDKTGIEDGLKTQL
ncbi:MAG: hypothetical protein GOMPHAMPRED_002056 [Gomphillus americanus]|uniref:Peptidase M24 domain-containing protein n=1 Tax=Gomphillus americanus TaxID=1940652 RepID=A0A8H3FCV1_9LECA|nr:MAG: hypothetical protein GOMPHAMPRED_002056 [Gomphillus americanus]